MFKSAPERNYKYRRRLAAPHKAEQEGFVFNDTDIVDSWLTSMYILAIMNNQCLKQRFDSCNRVGLYPGTF